MFYGAAPSCDALELVCGTTEYSEVKLKLTPKDRIYKAGLRKKGGETRQHLRGACLQQDRYKKITRRISCSISLSRRLSEL